MQYKEEEEGAHHDSFVTMVETSNFIMWKGNLLNIENWGKVRLGSYFRWNSRVTIRERIVEKLKWNVGH